MICAFVVADQRHLTKSLLWQTADVLWREAPSAKSCCKFVWRRHRWWICTRGIFHCLRALLTEYGVVWKNTQVASVTSFIPRCDCLWFALTTLLQRSFGYGTKRGRSHHNQLNALNSWASHHIKHDCKLWSGVGLNHGSTQHLHVQQSSWNPETI